MIDILTEFFVYMLYFSAFCLLFGILEFISDFRRKQKKKKSAALKKRRAMQKAIREKDAADYYNMAKRHMTPKPPKQKILALPKAKHTPIRMVKGVFMKEFYSLPESLRKRIL